MSASFPVGAVIKASNTPTNPPTKTLPRHARGMRIGLVGGTFNPPHQAHLLISLIALKRLKLDRVWWLVTPGNPLKNNTLLPPVAERIHAARNLARHPRIDVTGFESAIHTRYTYDTLAWLVRRHPGVRFVWLMGADNLAGFHRWNRWKAIFRLIPVAVMDRPGATFTAARGKAALTFSSRRLPESAAPKLALKRPPAWVFLHGTRSSLSSTELRRHAAKP